MTHTDSNIMGNVEAGQCDIENDTESKSASRAKFRRSVSTVLTALRFRSELPVHYARTDEPIGQLQFSPDGKWLVAGGITKIYVFAVRDGVNGAIIFLSPKINFELTR